MTRWGVVLRWVAPGRWDSKWSTAPGLARPILIGAAVLTLAGRTALHGQINPRPLDYPITPRGEAVDRIGGRMIPDPYRWLGEGGEPVDRWVAAQDSLAWSYLTAWEGWEPLRRRVDELIIRSGVRLPVASEERLFFTRYRPDSSGAIRLELVLRSRDGRERLLDSWRGEEASGIISYVPSPDGETVALAFRTVAGGSWLRWRFLVVADDVLLPDVLEGAFFGHSPLAWGRDARTVYATLFARASASGGPAATRGQPRVVRYRPGAGGDQEAETLHPPSSERTSDLSFLVGDDGALFVQEELTGPAESWIFRLDPGGQRTELHISPGQPLGLVGVHDQRLLVHGPGAQGRGEVLSMDAKRPGMPPTTVVPAQEDVLYRGGQGQPAPLLIGDRLVLPYHDELDARLEIRDVGGRKLQSVPVPPGGSLFNSNGANALSAGPAGEHVFFAYLGVTDPVAVYEVALESGEVHAFLRPELPFSPEPFLTERVGYLSQDGTLVSMSLTRRRDVRRGDRPPVLIDAYGADGFVLFPYYSAWRMALLERGGIVAIPHVRGGGLHGESWHRAAVGATKVRSVEDLEAAVAWFVEEGWTDAARVVVTGVSLGGVLPAAALTRRRQALGGAIVAYPVVDVHRYRRYGHRLSEDLGDPHDAPVAEGMMAYAPYPWIEDGCYPPTLILASDTDEVTPPVHAYKLTAGLQAAQECDAPVLLKMIWGSAHASFGSASFSALDAFTAQIGFMLRTVR